MPAAAASGASCRAAAIGSASRAPTWNHPPVRGNPRAGQQVGRLVRRELLLGTAEELRDGGGGLGVGLPDPRAGESAEVAEGAEYVRVPQREHDGAGAALGQPGDRPARSGRQGGEVGAHGGGQVDGQVGLDPAERAVDALGVAPSSTR